MKGIVLAGGAGSRLAPLTKITSKQLLPCYNKPLIYYPISTLMLAGMKEILVIVAPPERGKFEDLLGDGRQFGINFQFALQEKPRGIAESLVIAEDFLFGDSACLVLGDNIFHGPGLGRALANYSSVKGAHIFGYPVKNPEAYGIATVDESGSVIKLTEKPNGTDSNLAIPGLYFFDSQASKFAKTLEPSSRGELEILDLLEKYRSRNELTLGQLPFGTAWFDSGTFTDLHDASTYVRLMEERTGVRVGDPLNVARVQGWIK